MQLNDRRRGRYVIYGVVFGVGLSGAVARRVGHADLGCDAVAAHQFVGGGAGAKAQLAVAQIHHLGFQLATIAQGQDHGVVHFDVAAHGAAQGHARLIIRFRFVDDVVAPHHDWVEVDAQLRCHGVNAAIVGRGAGVAGRVGDAGRHLIAAFRQRGSDIHAVTTTRLHGGGQGLLSAIGIGHH